MKTGETKACFQSRGNSPTIKRRLINYLKDWGDDVTRYVSVSVKENEALFLYRVKLYIIIINANRLNYLNNVLAFWYVISRFNFEASNSERPNLLQKLLPLHFVGKRTALCCSLVTDECTAIPFEEFLIC